MGREIFTKLAERQAQGLMFHSNMADYYGFLNLCELKEYHDCQYLKESKTFRDIKDYFIKNCHKTLILDKIDPIKNITPVEWNDKTSMDVNKDTIRTLTKKSFEIYMAWETETYEIFKQCADELFDKGYYDSYRFVRDLMDDVEIEKSHIVEIVLDLQSVDYDVNAIKGISYKLHCK